MNSLQTLEQKRARLCLICVERLKLLKEEGKWKELKDNKIIDFLPEKEEDFLNFKNYEGVKKEVYEEFKKAKKSGKSYNDFKNEFKKGKLDYTKDYSSHAKRLPQIIISNGLIPALAFYKSKGKDRGQIYQDISEILEIMEFKPFIDWKNQNRSKGLLNFLLESDAGVLRLMTNEVLSISVWLKRMVESELKESESEQIGEV